jgi:hypothetical protein
VVERWHEYFESLLNVEDDRRANLRSVGRGVTSRNVGNYNVNERQKMKEAVKNLKNGAAVEEDRIAKRNVGEGSTSGCGMVGASV